ARRTVHRRRQAALLTEPVVGLAGERRDRVFGKERRCNPPVGGLLGDGLGPVLAELDPRRVVRLGPGAPGAVEAVGLVEAQQGAGALAPTHLGADLAGGL